MKSETARREIESLDFYLQNHTNDYSEESHTAMMMAIKALEQQRPMEKFENAKDHIYKLAGDYKCWDNRLTWDEALELCHILEQEPILDKIRAEIEQERVGYPPSADYYKAIMKCLQIIDKYKESEDKK